MKMIYIYSEPGEEWIGMKDGVWDERGLGCRDV